MLSLRQKLSLDGPIWIIGETLYTLLRYIDNEHDAVLISEVLLYILKEKPSKETFYNNENYCKVAFDALWIAEVSQESNTLASHMLTIREVIGDNHKWDTDDYDKNIILHQQRKPPCDEK